MITRFTMERVVFFMLVTLGLFGFHELNNRVSIPVAFSAYLGLPISDTEKNQTIIFDRVFLNEGDGYDKSTGVFTVPISGVYQFSVFLDGLSTGLLWIHGVLTVNDKTMFNIRVDTREAYGGMTGGNSAIIGVHKGDEVKVKSVQNGSYIVGYYTAYSTFSGFLVYVI